MAIRVCIFDAYGTLFDVAAAARLAAKEPGNETLADAWPKLAEFWRQKQLQYTWLRAITGHHTDFWQVTQDGLDWALDALNLQNPALRSRLLELYHELAAYPEVPSVLSALKAEGFATGILSNGAPAMLDAAVKSARVGNHLDAVLSVEDVGVFKPSPKVYDMVGAKFGTDASDVLFVSSNGWDAAGAAGYGFQTAWINRADEPIDRLPSRPAHVLADLTPIPDLAKDL
jgi:2-haloacid dehalogenase